MRPAAGSPEMAAVKALPLPMGGTEPGPESALRKTDESSKGPGGARFAYLEEPNQLPNEKGLGQADETPGAWRAWVHQNKTKELGAQKRFWSKRKAGRKKEEIAAIFINIGN